MSGFGTGGPNMFHWAELNARGIDKAIPFPEAVFGWGHHVEDMPGGPPYTMFQLDGVDVAGGGREGALRGERQAAQVRFSWTICRPLAVQAAIPPSRLAMLV